MFVMCLGGKVNLIQCTQGWDIDGKVKSMITLVTGLTNQKNNGARVGYHWMGKPETKSHFGGGGINSYGAVILNWMGERSGLYFNLFSNFFVFYSCDYIYAFSAPLPPFPTLRLLCSLTIINLVFNLKISSCIFSLAFFFFF